VAVHRHPHLVHADLATVQKTDPFLMIVRFQVCDQFQSYLTLPDDLFTPASSPV